MAVAIQLVMDQLLSKLASCKGTGFGCEREYSEPSEQLQLCGVKAGLVSASGQLPLASLALCSLRNINFCRVRVCWFLARPFNEALSAELGLWGGLFNYLVY